MPRSLPPAVAALLHDQHGVGSWRQLRHAGLSERRITTEVRGGILVKINVGTYAEAGAWTEADQRVRLLMRLLGAQFIAPDAVGAGTTAATAWRLPVRALPTRPELIRAPHLGVLSGVRVERSSLPETDVVRHTGLLVTTMARSVADVAATSDLADALITIDSALRRGITLDELRQQVVARQRPQGRARAMGAIECGDPGSESWLESLSRGRQIQRGMVLPLCNVVIRAQGRWVRVDELWVELGVIGECDGKGKYDDLKTGDSVIWREKRRHEWLEDLGFGIARWGTPEVADDGAVMEARVNRAVGRQFAVGATWPAGVTAELPLLGGVIPPPRVIAEVQRLAALGFPIWFTDEDGQRVPAHRFAA